MAALSKGQILSVQLDVIFCECANCHQPDKSDTFTGLGSTLPKIELGAINVFSTPLTAFHRVPTPLATSRPLMAKFADYANSVEDEDLTVPMHQETGGSNAQKPCASTENCQHLKRITLPIDGVHPWTQKSFSLLCFVRLPA